MRRRRSCGLATTWRSRSSFSLNWRQALFRRGLTALYEGGRAFVHTPGQPIELLGEIEGKALGDPRVPAARSPAEPENSRRRPPVRAAALERSSSARRRPGRG
jgi:hypothetical protein